MDTITICLIVIASCHVLYVVASILKFVIRYFKEKIQEQDFERLFN